MEKSRFSVIEFTGLLSSNLTTISKIEWWLLKYTDLYKETHNFIYSQYLFQLEDGSIARFPPSLKTTDEDIFLDLFKALDIISDYHRNEKYFELEMIDYYKIKNSQTDLKKWVKKNENLGAVNYACFLVDYLDYDVDSKVEHLNIFISTLEELDIYIQKQDFKNTIEFLEIFNELYWVKEIIPKSLE